MNPTDSSAEWIEADGTRRIRQRNSIGNSHASLSRAAVDCNDAAGGTNGRLVNGFDVGGNTRPDTSAVSSQRYGPDVDSPDGAARIESFEYEPWPRWRYKIDNDLVLEQELFVPEGRIGGFHFVEARCQTGTIDR